MSNRLEEFVAVQSCGTRASRTVRVSGHDSLSFSVCPTFWLIAQTGGLGRGVHMYFVIPQSTRAMAGCGHEFPQNPPNVQKTLQLEAPMFCDPMVASGSGRRARVPPEFAPGCPNNVIDAHHAIIDSLAVDLW